MNTDLPRQAYDRACAAASAEYRAEWQAAQKLPTLDQASEAAHAAEQKRTAAWQAAHRDYQGGRRHWLEWQPGEFDTAPAQDTLFDASSVARKPDAYGTPDMFAGQP